MTEARFETLEDLHCQLGYIHQTKRVKALRLDIENFLEANEDEDVTCEFLIALANDLLKEGL